MLGGKGDGGAVGGRAGFGSVSEIKSAVMLYHSNIKGVYPEPWVTKCVDTILLQTHQDFDIFELNYGRDEHSVFGGHLQQLNGRMYTFLKRRFDDHSMAMNFLLDTIFAKGYDAVFNTNLDDFYAPTRFAKQVPSQPHQRARAASRQLGWSHARFACCVDGDGWHGGGAARGDGGWGTAGLVLLRACQRERLCPQPATLSC